MFFSGHGEHPFTDEDPAVHSASKAEAGFSPPLNIIDGTARIVDPIFVGRLTGELVWVPVKLARR